MEAEKQENSGFLNQSNPSPLEQALSAYFDSLNQQDTKLEEDVSKVVDSLEKQHKEDVIEDEIERIRIYEQPTARQRY
jgi:hypothetical protein